MTYTMKVAGLERELPLCKVSDELYIGAFIIFGDAELTVACASALLERIPADSYDYMLTAEAKSIPLIHEMARQSGAKKYFIARKGSKVYMPDPIHVSVRSITTLRQQDLFLGADDCALIKGRRILIVDDVISTGESLTPWRSWCAPPGAQSPAAPPSWPRATPSPARTSPSWPPCRSSTPTAASRAESRPLPEDCPAVPPGRRGGLLTERSGGPGGMMCFSQ